MFLAFLSPPSVFAADSSSTTSQHTSTTMSDSQLKLNDEVTEDASLHGRKVQHALHYEGSS